MQEGQIWEAFMLAPKFKLNNLIVFVDYNGSQNDGFVKDTLDLEPITDKILAFNWNVISISGHDMDEIEVAVKKGLDKNQEKPTCILMKTQKGKGVSFLQDPVWHAKVPNEEEYKKALEELK